MKSYEKFLSIFCQEVRIRTVVSPLLQLPILSATSCFVLYRIYEIKIWENTNQMKQRITKTTSTITNRNMIVQPKSQRTKKG